MAVTSWQRFWGKVGVASPDACWLWRASLARGYGKFWLDGRLRPAHQVAYEWLVGPIPVGLEIDHLCRTKACVNPDHLEAVTHATNQKRIPAKTVCKAGHSEWGRQKPNNSTFCRACARERERKRYAARRARKRDCGFSG